MPSGSTDDKQLFLWHEAIKSIHKDGNCQSHVTVTWQVHVNGECVMWSDSSKFLGILRFFTIRNLAACYWHAITGSKFSQVMLQ